MDIDYILTGKPTKTELLEFFKSGCEERYTVEAIKTHLRTEEQKRIMYEEDFSIESMLNGRYSIGLWDIVYEIYKDWNEKLGEKVFGS